MVPTDDNRIKPDLVSPGTHMTGAQPQTGAEFNGSGTCNPQFPAGSVIYTLVSGTSQAAPGVTGFAALIRTWYVDTIGGAPSPAMTKALMINTATDLRGGSHGAASVLAGVPTQEQGWGRINLDNILDETRRRVIDQSDVFTTTGFARSRFYSIWQPAQPLRVTLVWTDAVGPTTGNAFVNDLDLEVTAGGKTYRGNVFSGGSSVSGGAADIRNNVENVFLPAGVSGPVKVRVIGTNIAGDGVPGNSDTTDQDYALVVSNVMAVSGGTTPVLTPIGLTSLSFEGDGDAYLEPGEFFSFRQRLKNVGNAAATGVAGVLSARSSEAAVTQPNANWPNLAVNASAAGSPPFRARVSPAMACGDAVNLSIAVSAGPASIIVPVAFRTGRRQPTGVSFTSTDFPKSIPDNVPSGVSSTLSIGTPGLISDIDVTIGLLNHTFVGDLAIDLTSPAGTTVRIFNRQGGSGDNLTNTVFDDSAATAISAGTAPFTGSFRPVEPLSAFNNQQSQGTWILTVRDLAADDTGTLNSWGVTRKSYICS